MKLLIIADDLTGALDTGIRFSAAGIPTCVETGFSDGWAFDFGRWPVIVAHSASRHLPAEEAYAAVEKITAAALSAGAGILYKKTDSGLRGRVGAELSALCRTADGPLWFVPAYPEMDRVTRNGIHFCGGVPVSESPFGRDPADPVTESFVPDLLAQTGSVPAVSVPAGTFPAENGISVFDCDDASAMPPILEEGLRRGVRLYAGCAGFAAALADGLPFPREKQGTLPKWKGLFVACGSLHPASLAQVRAAVSAGFEEVAPDADTLEALSSLEPAPCSVLHTGNARFPGRSAAETASVIQAAFARLIPGFLRDHPDRLAMVIGGDALEGLLRALSASRLIPLASLPGGAVLAGIETADGTFSLVTKSGGFGDPDTILKIRQLLAPSA